MVINRRSALKLLTAAVGSVTAPNVFAAVQQDLYLSSRKVDGEHYATIFADTGDIQSEFLLPGRGHGGTYSKVKRLAVLFARRPGHFAMVIDTQTQTIHQMFESGADRHFFGHGFFSPDGQFLYATENDYERDRSVLGVYDVGDRFRRLGEVECGGIGAHEVILLSDKRTVAVAIGGISTHPNFPRLKLNLASMKPALSFLDLKSRKITGVFELPPAYHQLSIRHIAEGPNKSVVFGGQYQGSKTDLVHLVGVKRWAQSSLEFFNMPTDVEASLKQYVGSVAALKDGSEVAITSPRAGEVAVFNGLSGNYIGRYQQEDVCGAAAHQDRFLFTSGNGQVITNPGQRGVEQKGAWDNHLTPLS